MGGWGKKTPTKRRTRKARKVAPGQDVVSDRAYGLSKEFAADDAVRMPSIDASLEAAARLRRELFARSGRDSTRLVGRSVYSNTYFGDTA